MIGESRPDTAIVTGGAGELGRAIARELALAGFQRIALVDMDDPACRAAAAELEEAFPETTVVSIVADIADPSAPESIMDIVLEGGRILSCLVNNAAVSRAGSAATMTRADWDVMMAVNVAAPMFMCQAAIPHWREHGARAAVVNISSRAWLAGSGAAYSASKAGLVGLTHALAVELGPYGVRVNAVGPSYFESSLTSGIRTPAERTRIAQMQAVMSPLGRIALPADIARTVAFLASDKAAFITGETIYVAGGSHLARSSISDIVTLDPKPSRPSTT